MHINISKNETGNNKGSSGQLVNYLENEIGCFMNKTRNWKPGEQMHVQVIVSRKDITDSIRLSPLNNSRGKNATHSLKVGQFDRVAFKQAAERTFDQTFDYNRETACRNAWVL
jgi:hypothetical protein